MPSYQDSEIWKHCLAPRAQDLHPEERERLRVGFQQMRERCIPVAQDIARDLPDFTVHDITHIDALWHCASMIAGKDVIEKLTPCEAFVLGGAFLMHDLGMALSAYPEGPANLRQTSEWRDALAQQLRRQGVDTIDEAALANADAEAQKRALAEALRLRHAKRAADLPKMEWKHAKRGETFYLMESAELRASFGELIGLIAYSHWWSVDRLTKDLPQARGASRPFPGDWTVDPVKLACLLRCADYSHLDELRAPGFLRALRQPMGVADEHWTFQGKLDQPVLNNDRLTYTSKSAFTLEEAGAWWLCFDTLSGLDAELRHVDSLLADTSRTRFQARAVSHVEDLARLAILIKPAAWQPVDTRIRVSAVADLVSRLGGNQLYGDEVLPPLRELIQNASDAVRARRKLDKLPDDWGEIRVRLGKDEDGTDWIQVEDTGIGMSQAVLSGPLLDFGTSFWNTPLMHEQLPGLASSGFEATGRYGIGFFSVFMWGDRVEVTTQRYDRGRDQTYVLAFQEGLQKRPILRTARPDEIISGGGTRVRVWLENVKRAKKLSRLKDSCLRIAPCLDVTLLVAVHDAMYETALTANDWIAIPDESLLHRLDPDVWSPYVKSRVGRYTVPALNIVKDDRGHVLGRSAPWLTDEWNNRVPRGFICVGGFRTASTISGFVGAWMGRATRASRDKASPIISASSFKKWVESQRHLVSKNLPPELLADLAIAFCSLAISSDWLPVARGAEGWLSLNEIAQAVQSMDEVLLYGPARTFSEYYQQKELKLHANVFRSSAFYLDVLSDMADGSDEWSLGSHEFGYLSTNAPRTCWDSVTNTVAKAWGVELEVDRRWLRAQETRDIGSVKGKPVTMLVLVLRRPVRKPSENTTTIKDISKPKSTKKAPKRKRL